jgi:hypothetical protein
MYSDYAPASRAAAVSAVAQGVTNAYKRVRTAKAASEAASMELAIYDDYQDRMGTYAFTEERARLMAKSSKATQEWHQAVNDLCDACEELERAQTGGNG